MNEAVAEKQTYNNNMCPTKIIEINLLSKNIVVEADSNDNNNKSTDTFIKNESVVTNKNSALWKMKTKRILEKNVARNSK